MNIIRLGDGEPVLSILVCTIESRRGYLTKLLRAFMPQLVGPVEFIIASDDGEVAIGDKRNMLLDEAWGEYICFFDDDDRPADDYVEQILTALESRPDCVGLKVRRTVDGVNEGTSTHSIRFEQNGNFVNSSSKPYYERVPNHLNPVRSELAREIRFKSLNSGEDTDYGVRLRPLLKTEVMIDKVLYYYDYRSQRPNENTNQPNFTSAAPIVPASMDAVIVSDASKPHLRAMTATTIRTLKQTVPHVNVIVVESSDVYWPGCTVVKPKQPFNYNAYLMLGIEQGRAPWVGLFNNDLMFRENWWMKILQAHARTGIPSLSPRCTDDPRQDAPKDTPEIVEGYRVGYELSGWAIVVKREVIGTIGGLDTSPVFHYSDDAYADQLRMNGIKHALVRDSIVNHRRSKTLSTLPPHVQSELKSDATGRYAVA